MNKKLLACILIPIASVAIASTATYAAASVPGLNKEVDELQEQVTTLQEQVAELQAKATQLKNEMDSSIDQVKSDYGNKINNVQSQIDTLNNQLIALSAKLEADKEALQSDYNTKITNLKAYVDEQCVLLQANIDTNTASLNTLSTRHDNEVEALEAKHQQDLADLKEEFEDNLAETELELSETIANLNTSFDQRLKELDEKYEEESTRLQAIIDTDIATLDTFKSQYLTEKQALETKLASDLEKLEYDFNEEVESINTQISSLATSLSTLSSEMNSKIADIQSDYNDKISDLIDRIETLETVTYHTVTFNTDGGSEIVPQQVKHGEKIVKPADPTKNFYTFEGWTYKGETWLVYGSVVTEDMELTATWYQTEEQKDAEKAFDIRYGTKPILYGSTISYGLYPQTHVNDSGLIAELNILTTPETNGWYFHNGDYYAKIIAYPDQTSYSFYDGESIVTGTEYWFKCEPIIWNVLSNSECEYYILSSMLLDTHRFNDLYNGMVGGCYANNYKNSEIRSWLNNDFYSTAFLLNNEYVQTTEVDNSAQTTDSKSNPYTCANTFDKVFLPSYKDYFNASYGFSSQNSSDLSRQCKLTDYALARGAITTYNNAIFGELYNTGTYYTRSPRSDSFDGSWCVYYDGLVGIDHVNLTPYTIRPAIRVAI